MHMLKNLKIVTVLILSFLFGCAQNTSQNPQVAANSTLEEPPEGQLPKTAIPLHYDLELTIIPQKTEFSGKVRIALELKDAAHKLWLHGKKLKVSKSTATLADGKTIEIAYNQVTESGVAKIDFGQRLQAQRLELHFEFTAPFDADLHGLYRVKSDERWYAFTQFEPISARLAFPSFDEPIFKVPFDITLIVDKNHAASAPYSAISEELIGADKKRIRYKKTAPLPTYLIAFAVGPMDVVNHAAIAPSDVRSNPVALRGFAPKGKGKLLDYALKNTGTILNLLESYFGMAYPYDKIDIIAVPDFSAGAMENVGVITFRDWLLLIDEKSAPARQLRAYAYVMAHELAHQWFGNLVTMPWWDDLWLNEAFSSWIENIVIRDFEPSYKAELSIVQNSLYAMKTDSKVSARQIRQPIANEHDIHNAFDGITYAKGEGVLGMFENFLGPKVFQKSLQYHMKQFAHGNATAADFLRSVSQSTGRDISSSFESFILQPGVPLLDIQLKCQPDKPATIEVKQSRYLPIGSTGDSNKTWEIPYCYRYQIGQSVHNECQMLQSLPKQTIALQQKGCPKWYAPNAKSAGYYRWNLTESGWKKLQNNLDALEVTDILSLTDSLKASALAGKIDATAILQAAPLFVNSDERRVASTPMGTLRFVHDHILEEKHLPNLESFAQNLYERQFQRLGFGSEKSAPSSDDDKLFRQSLLSFLASTAKTPAVRGKLQSWGNTYLGLGNTKALAPESVDPNLVATALRVTIEDGELSALQTAIEHLSKTSNPIIRSQLLSGIAAADTPEKSKLVRNLLLSETLRSNERSRLLRNHMSVPKNTQALWEWVQTNYDAIAKVIPVSHLGYFPFIASSFCSSEKSSEVRSFFATKVQDFPGGPRNLESALESIELCSARKQAMEKAMNQFFQRPLLANR